MPRVANNTKSQEAYQTMLLSVENPGEVVFMDMNTM